MMKVVEIQNFEAPELDVYARLTENQLVNRADPAKGNDARGDREGTGGFLPFPSAGSG